MTEKEFGKLFDANIMQTEPSAKIIEWERDGLLAAHFPELHRCIGLQQDARFHTGDVFSHCVGTCDAAPQNKMLRWAGLLHDIGKPIVAKFIDGRVTFYRHEIASVRVAAEVLTRFRIKSRPQIILLVRHHMYNYSSEWTDRAIASFILKSQITLQDLQTPDSFPLFQLRIADRVSRGKEPVTKRQRDFERRLRRYFERERSIAP
jgi:tRNA nucleotidyltransferase (CCA-adding enzyme)